MVAENITPKHPHCVSGSCSSVYRLEDGRLLIVGENAVAKAIDVKDQPLGDNELAIIISDDLLSNLEKEWTKEIVEQCASVADEYEKIMQEEPLFPNATAKTLTARSIAKIIRKNFLPLQAAEISKEKA